MFRRHGYEKTTMEDIARQAHKAKRSLYNHFKSKEEVFGAALKDELTGIQTVLSPIFEDGSLYILEKLNAYLLKRAQLFSEAVLWQQVLKGEVSDQSRGHSEAAAEAVAEFERWEHDLFVSVWNCRPHPDNVKIVIAESVAFADMTQMALKGLNYLFFVQNKYDQYKDSYAFLINLLLKSVMQNCNNNNSSIQ